MYAWCIQITAPPDPSRAPTKVRVTCFWQHDLKAIWGVGNSIQQRLPAMLVGLVSTVQTHGSRMPHLHGYGRGVHVAHVDFQGPRQLLTLEYAVAGEEDEDDAANSLMTEGLDDGLRALKEYRRLERSVECALPSAHSWDVRIHTRASSSSIAAPHYMVQATQPTSSSMSWSSSTLDESITLRISHPKPPEHSVLRITVAIEPSASLGAGASARQLRVNGSSQTIHRIEPRDPSSSIHFSSPSSSSSSTSRRKILEDANTIGSLALQRTSTTASSSSASSSATTTTTAAASIVTTTSDKTTRTAPGGLHGSGRGGRPGIPGVRSTRSAAAEKAVVTLVRRNYIYFTSLLQEPEAKWSKPITESRGVTVTQLNSIDPTLVVYRAEAVFVGVGVWDLLSIVATPGVGAYWNRGQENAVYLEHVSELTELWHLKNRAAWPVK